MRTPPCDRAARAFEGPALDLRIRQVASAGGADVAGGLDGRPRRRVDLLVVVQLDDLGGVHEARRDAGEVHHQRATDGEVGGPQAAALALAQGGVELLSRASGGRPLVPLTTWRPWRGGRTADRARRRRW